MKRLFLLLSVAILAFSCTDDAEEVTPGIDQEENPEINPEITHSILTFEDEDYLADANYLGYSNWSSLIDEAEYGGDLLYALDDNWTGYSEYAWYDGGNTELASEVVTAWGSSAYWNGGVAVSNYYFEVNSSSQATYLNQLSVPFTDADGNSGYNSSANFAVVFNDGYIYFADGEARQIEYMYVAPTSYWLTIATYGDYGTAAMTSSDYFKLIATSVDADGATLATAEFYLAQNGELPTEWQMWDLSSLGEVTKVVFSTDGSVVNEYGSALPGYFAIDDITVSL